MPSGWPCACRNSIIANLELSPRLIQVVARRRCRRCGLDRTYVIRPQIELDPPHPGMLTTTFVLCILVAICLLDASLDTSFWNIASQIGVAPYLFEFFQVHYCQAVADEIVTTDPAESALIYPQAMLFKVLSEDGRLHRAEPVSPLALFGSGEAHAIALAHERGRVLLINDFRPLQFARSLGVRRIKRACLLCIIICRQAHHAQCNSRISHASTHHDERHFDCPG